MPGTAARIARDALEQRLADALDRASLLVVAGAGFGKTTALEAAVQRSGLTGAWVRCAEGDDAGTLMTRILTALERAMPGAVDVLGERLVVPGQRVDPCALAAQVSGGLAELLVEPLVLVLDDAEHVRASPAACALVAELLAADGAIRVAVATRTELPVRAARLEAAGRLTVIGAADLVLDARECAELLHARRGSEPQPDEVDAVLEATEGWALGVAAAAVAGGAALDGRALAADGRAFAFLAEEVLDMLPAELAGRLEDSALPAELDPLTLGALELPDGFVAEVRGRGLFLGSAGAAPGAVRYHPLFRALLLRRGEQRGDPGRRAALHVRLASALQEAGRPADAIEHWFAAHEPAQAAGAIAAAGATLTRTAPERVLGWLARLPAGERARPELALLEGSTVNAAGTEPTRAIALLRAAVDGFAARKDAALAGPLRAPPCGPPRRSAGRRGRRPARLPARGPAHVAGLSAGLPRAGARGARRGGGGAGRRRCLRGGGAPHGAGRLRGQPRVRAAREPARAPRAARRGDSGDRARRGRGRALVVASRPGHRAFVHRGRPRRARRRRSRGRARGGRAGRRARLRACARDRVAPTAAGRGGPRGARARARRPHARRPRRARLPRPPARPARVAAPRLRRP